MDQSSKQVLRNNLSLKLFFILSLILIISGLVFLALFFTAIPSHTASSALAKPYFKLYLGLGLFLVGILFSIVTFKMFKIDKKQNNKPN